MMKLRFLFPILLLAVAAHGQIFFQASYSQSAGTVATPTFSPASPYSGGATSVSVTCPSGASCYVCQDTTNTCNPSTTYSSAISVSATGYIRAQAKQSGKTDSAIASWQGTISGGCTSGSCSDTFTGTAGILLATHNSAWVDVNATFLVANAALSGSDTIQPKSSYVSGGGLYTSSTSDTSQIVFKGSSTASTTKYVGVRGTSNVTRGYYFGATNWSNATGTPVISKNGTVLTTCAALNQQVDHTIKLVASGTSTVTLNVYVDGSGTPFCTTTDSSSTITSGNPFFYFTGNGNLAAASFGTWQDN